MSIPPSGEQFEIRHGDQSATIVEVGGGIRSYIDSGRDVLQPYPVDAMCDGAHGMPLIPWPNRLADGRYTFDGTDYQVGLTEPAMSNAIHGFLRWRPWQAIEREKDRVVMGTRLYPQDGYPFLLDVRIEYSLAAAGLTVTTTATNSGDTALPFGAGQHPYLSPGTEAILDDCILQLQAATRIVTNERELPAGTEPVSGSPYDFRLPRRIGDLSMDSAFTDLARDDDGLAWVRLEGPDGQTVSLWVDGSYPFVELFTGDGLADDRRRRGLGSEPMTCPPNAFASGDHLVRLEPGRSTTSAWGVGLSAEPA